MDSVSIGHRTGERGAALVTGLVLLLVLMLLAVAGMRTAGVEFIMAGNEQFHQNAFQASETGIMQAIQAGTFDPIGAVQNLNGVVPNAPADTYATIITPQLNGAPQAAIWGNSWNSFATYHFEIQSTGASARNALATHTQAVAVLAPFQPEVNGPGGLN